MELTWHGHSTWYVAVGDTSLFVDSFFDNPATSLNPSDVETPNYVLLTHGHADHTAHTDGLDDTTVVGTPELTGYVEAEIDVDDITGMSIGGAVELSDALVTVIHADHTSGINTGYEHEAGMSGGYMISDAVPMQEPGAESTTFYHAGGAGFMTDMREIFDTYFEPDAAALPVDDHFTMELWWGTVAADWLGVSHAFPIHYNTLPAIGIGIRDFEREVKVAGSRTGIHALDGGESFTLE